jgi:uncharacterized short protein YbdD (DUF466 family)
MRVKPGAGGREPGAGGREPGAGVLARLGGIVRRIAGMPDYPGYLRHMAEKHAGCPVLTERQFYDEQVQARYGNGASRCC